MEMNGVKSIHTNKSFIENLISDVKNWYKLPIDERDPKGQNFIIENLEKSILGVQSKIDDTEIKMSDGFAEVDSEKQNKFKANLENFKKKLITLVKRREELISERE